MAPTRRAKQHEYGFELTVFQTLRGQVPPYYAAHYAISDITRGEFHYDQRVAFGSLAALPEPGSTNGFDLGVQDWRVKGLNGADTLSATMSDYTIALNLKDTLPHPVASTAAMGSSPRPGGLLVLLLTSADEP